MIGLVKMKNKEIDGIKFNVYSDKRIEGDFIKPNEAVYFANDVEITGQLKVRCIECRGFISVHESYVVKEWDKVGRYQEVYGHQEIGQFQIIQGFQKIGLSQSIGGFQDIGGSQTVYDTQMVNGWQKIKREQEIGWSQTVRGNQEVGSHQKIGYYQEINGDLRAESSLVGLCSRVNGKYDVKGKVFIGICAWRDTTKKDETLTCGKFISGDIKYGNLEEVGFPKKKMVKIRAKDQIIEGEFISD